MSLESYKVQIGFKHSRRAKHYLTENKIQTLTFHMYNVYKYLSHCKCINGFQSSYFLSLIHIYCIITCKTSHITFCRTKGTLAQQHIVNDVLRHNPGESFLRIDGQTRHSHQIVMEKLQKLKRKQCSDMYKGFTLIVVGF